MSLVCCLAAKGLRVRLEKGIYFERAGSSDAGVLGRFAGKKARQDVGAECV